MECADCRRFNWSVRRQTSSLRNNKSRWVATILSRGYRCFRHQLLLLCHERHRCRIDNDQRGRFPKTTSSDIERTIADGKISLNVSRRVVSPACIAGVLISPPNFSAIKRQYERSCPTLTPRTQKRINQFDSRRGQLQAISEGR
jgi:hypothetical protein